MSNTMWSITVSLYDIFKILVIASLNIRKTDETINPKMAKYVGTLCFFRRYVITFAIIIVPVKTPTPNKNPNLVYVGLNILPKKSSNILYTPNDIYIAVPLIPGTIDENDSMSPSEKKIKMFPVDFKCIVPSDDKM